MTSSESTNQIVSLPKKKNYRQRAHANVFGDYSLEYPLKPSEMNWSVHYPLLYNTPSFKVNFADIGCGYGGLTIALSKLFPDKITLGMEIRVQVTEYVKEKISALRKLNTNEYQNISVIRANAMKFLPNFFSKSQLDKIFFLFPDPHFKKRKHRNRIITKQLLSEYAFILKPGGLIYLNTDVWELYEWMCKEFDECLLFTRVSNEEMRKDVCFDAIMRSSEEANKVERLKGDEKYPAVYKRVLDLDEE